VNSILQVIVFYALAAATLVSALGVIASRNIMRSAFWLVPCFLAVGGLYLMLGSTFLAAIQVVVYVGAIAVLFLFALMLTRPPQEPGPPATNRFVWWAALGAIVLAVVLVAYIQRDAAERWPERPALAERYQVAPVAGTQPTGPQTPAPITTFGRELMTRYVLPFEITSVLLLAALIGAIVMARKDSPPEADGDDPPTAPSEGVGNEETQA
jgi:NADH:ubiquinone oxidoreductase subunit 6 (subunit J)